MQIGQLNDDILALIFDYAVLDSTESFRKWKNILPVVHVNKRWSILTRPLVHKCVIIEANGAGNSSQPKLISNLEFVAKGCHHKHIRSLIISAENIRGGLFFCQELYKMLSEYGKKLSTTRAIIMTTYFFGPDIEEKKTKKLAYQFYRLATMIMPKVTTLSFNEILQFNLSDHIHKALVSAYKHQLSSLEISNGFEVLHSCSLDKLTSLDMNYFSYLSSPSNAFNVTIDSLVQLTLQCIQRDFAWDLFSNKKSQEPSMLTFGCLKKLVVSFNPCYSSELTRSESNLTLHFPVLEELDLSYAQSNSLILQNSVFPQHLELIKIKASTESLEWLAQSRNALPLPMQLTLITDMRDIDGANSTTSEVTSKAINKYLNTYHGQKETVLHVDLGYEFFPDCDAVKFANLTTIHLLFSRYMTTAIKIIESAPALLCLLITAGPEFELLELVENDYLDKPLVPFDTRLKKLFINLTRVDEQIQKSFVVDVSYMMLRIPSLSKLYVDHFSFKDVSAFSQRHKDRYPHLENMTIMAGRYLR